MVVRFMSRAFEVKVRWRLWLGARRRRILARRQRRAERQARESSDRLVGQVEDLETRVLLSATTAVSDQAVVRQVGAPITVDVLGNDIDGAGGGLSIISVSVSVGGSGSASGGGSGSGYGGGYGSGYGGGYGSGSGSGSGSGGSSGGSGTAPGYGATVTIIDGDTSASGAAARDRLELDLEEGFTGTLVVSYTIQDQQGNVSTTSLTMETDASLGEAYEVNSGGALTLSRGVGDGGYTPSPTEGYTPEVYGNFTYTTGIAGAGLTMASGESGTQGIGTTVVTTWSDADNWSYSETVVYSYDVTRDDGAGTDLHQWGGYTYTLSVVSIAGIETTTFTYTSNDHYDGHITTPTEGGSFTSHFWGNQIYVLMTSFTDNVVWTDFGSLYISNTSTGGSSGYGTYQKPLPGGLLTGSMNSGGTDFNTSTTTLGYTELLTGDWYVSGMVTMSGMGNSHYDSSGSGSYGSSTYTGSMSESNGNHDSYNYAGGGTYSTLGGWVFLGSGSTTGGDYRTYGYSGSGTSTRDANGGTITTSVSDHGHDNSAGDFHVDYTLGGDGWQIVNGTAGNSGDKLDYHQYSGSGSYSITRDIYSGSETVSGSVEESGHRRSHSDFDVTGTLNTATGEWTWTGTGGGDGDYHSLYAYSGSGSYSRSIHGGSVGGSVNDRGRTYDEGSHELHSTLTPGGWVTTGSASDRGSLFSHYDYDGSGSYSRVVGDTTYNGFQQQDGHDTRNRTYETSSTLFADGLVVVSGSGSGSTDSHDHAYFSGAASYSRLIDAAAGAYLTGTRNEEREDTNKSKANFTLAGNDSYYGDTGGGLTWRTTSGSGTSESFGKSHFDWSGSANYTTTRTEGNSTYNTSASQSERGQNNSAYSSKSQNAYNSVLDKWERVSGNGTESGDEDFSFISVSSGSYQKTVDSAETNYHASYSGDFLNSNTTSGWSKWSTSSTVAGGEWAQSAGSASGGGRGETISSKNGSGTYSYDGGVNNSHVTGTVNENSFSRNGNSFNTKSTWSAAGGWVKTGSLSASGNVTRHSDYSGTGSYGSTGSSGASGSTGSGTTDEHGHENTGSKFSSQSTLSASGAWELTSGASSDWGDSFKHTGFSGTENFSSSGSDDRYGVWRTSGSAKTNGYRDTGRVWNTKSEVQQGSWRDVSGSSREWNETLTVKSHSGSGGWTKSLGATSGFLRFELASGTVTDSGMERTFEKSEIKSELDLGAASASGDSWKIVSGSSRGEHHLDRTVRYDYYVQDYTVAIPGGEMVGDITYYDYTRDVEDTNVKQTLTFGVPPQENPSDPPAAQAWHWRLTSGSSKVTHNRGAGKDWSASGAISTGGILWDGFVPVGTWSATGIAQHEGRLYGEGGGYVESEVQGGEWVETDFGITASGGLRDAWSWSASGTYNRGSISGTFSQGAGHDRKEESWLAESKSSGGLTGAQHEFETNHSDSGYSASGHVWLYGTSGLFKASLSRTIDTKTEVHSSASGTGINDHYFVPASGTRSFDSTDKGSKSYSGSHTYASSTGTTTTNFRFKDTHNNSTNIEWTLVPSLLASSGNGGAAEVDPWQVTSGTVVIGKGSERAYSSRHDESYEAPYGISGTRFSENWSKFNTKLDATTTWSSSGSGSWETVGSSHTGGETGSKGGYSASGTFSIGNLSGSYWENGKNNNKSTWGVEGTWDSEADGWAYSGWANQEGGDSWVVGLKSSQDWNPVVAGGDALTGTETVDYEESYTFNYSASRVMVEAANGDKVFVITSGSGTETGNGHRTVSASASGSYSYTFDNGLGTVNGEAAASRRRHWDYNYTGDLSWNGGISSWEMSTSGSYNIDGFSRSNYSGSGSYTSTNGSGANFSTISVEIEESGESNSDYLGSGSWTNNDYSWSEEWGGDSTSDWKRITDTAYSSHYQSSGTWGHSISNGHGSSHRTETSHNESFSRSKYTESMTGGDLSWHQSSSGSGQYDSTDNYSANSHYDWDNLYNDGYGHVSTNNGFSDMAMTDSYSSYGSYSWESTYNDDGSEAHSYASAGGFHESHTYGGSWRYSWTDTYSYGGGSGSASGGSWSTGGTESGAYSGGWSNGDDWSYSGGWSVPANSGSSSGGGTAGDGIWRQADYGLVLSGGGSAPELDLPAHAPPSVSVGDISATSLPDPDAGKLAVGLILDVGEGATALWHGVEDAFAWAGQAVKDAFSAVGDAVAAAGAWLGDVTGLQVISDFATLVGAGFSEFGQILGSGIASIPQLIEDGLELVSNLSADQILDGIQMGLDVVGMIPGFGEIADGVNGCISLARGNYADAAMSFAAMVPMAGAAATAAKWGKKALSKADEVIAFAKDLKCAITNGCFDPETLVTIEAQGAWSDLGAGRSPDDFELVLGGEAVAVAETATTRMLPIRDVPLGTRVLTENPIRSDIDYAFPEPDQEAWALIRLEVLRRDGGIVDVELIRPRALLGSVNAVPGDIIPFDVSDLETESWAKVIEITDCPAIADGTGSVVTGRFVTRSVQDAITIAVDDGTKLTGTAVHPVWSVTRERWVPLGDLKVGEDLQGQDRTYRVVLHERHLWGRPVVNIEIHGEHVYEVTELGLLVHNSDSCKLGKALIKAGFEKPPFKTKGGVSIYQAAHIVPSKLLSTMTKAQKAKIKQIQKLLKKYDLNNAAENGFWARGANSKYGVSFEQGHLGTHTTEYFDDVIAAFDGVNSKQGALNALANLKGNIMNGNYL